MIRGRINSHVNKTVFALILVVGVFDPLICFNCMWGICQFSQNANAQGLIHGLELGWLYRAGDRGEGEWALLALPELSDTLQSFIRVVDLWLKETEMRGPDIVKLYTCQLCYDHLIDKVFKSHRVSNIWWVTLRCSKFVLTTRQIQNPLQEKFFLLLLDAVVKMTFLHRWVMSQLENYFKKHFYYVLFFSVLVILKFYFYLKINVFNLYVYYILHFLLLFHGMYLSTIL